MRNGCRKSPYRRRAPCNATDAVSNKLSIDARSVRELAVYRLRVRGAEQPYELMPDSCDGFRWVLYNVPGQQLAYTLLKGVADWRASTALQLIKL